MSGKVCFDEINRVKKLARMECIRMPAFMRNQEKYKKSIKQISQLNGLHLKHDQFKAPVAYLRRLKRGRRIGAPASTKKVRRKSKRGGRRGMIGDKGGSMDDGCTSDDSDDFVDDDLFCLEDFQLKGTRVQSLKETKCFEETASEMSLESFLKDKHRTYSLSIINNLDSVKTPHDGKFYNIEKRFQLENKFQKVEEKSSGSLEGSESNQDQQNGTMKPMYRSVSRASIQSRLSLRSYSLASRSNKNFNADNASVTSYSTDTARPDSANSRISTSLNSAVDKSEYTDSTESNSVKVNFNSNSSTGSTLAPLYTPAVSSSINSQNENWYWDSKNLSAPVAFYPKSTPLAPIKSNTRSMSGGSFVEQGPEKFIYPENIDLTESKEDSLENKSPQKTLTFGQQRSIGSWIKDIENIYKKESEREDVSREATPKGKLLKSRASSTANLLAKIE